VVSNSCTTGAVFWCVTHGLPFTSSVTPTGALAPVEP